MAEEQKWQEPDGHRLCANNCGFFGSTTTLNLCSKCYKDHCIRERQISDAKIVVEKSMTVTHSESCFPVSVSTEASSASHDVPSSSDGVNVAAQFPAVAAPLTQQPARCASCRKRVGLTGFRCRCGTTFCGSHRYPEQHGCTFDFKAIGKEEIARANPVVKAEKLHKI